MAAIDNQQQRHRVGGWAATHHLSTWLLICVLIAIALIVRPQLINFIIFAIIAAFMFLIRDVARLEGRAGGATFGRSTGIAMLVIVLIVLMMFFGVRYVAI